MINEMTDLYSVAAYLQRIGAEPRSLRTAVIKYQKGSYWEDVAKIQIGKDGSIDAPSEYAPTDAEAAMIRQDVLGAQWPEPTKLGHGYALPPELKAVDAETVFEVFDRQGKLVMIQQRVNIKKTGDKKYVPWTFWSDQRWRKMEPEGLLPLYGMETVKDHSTVFIHEGAKAARAMQRLIDPRTEKEIAEFKAHPWGEIMSTGAHVGWLGGALSPSRTDWSELTKAGVKRAYIISDNDAPGKAAIPRISMRLRGMTVFSVEFTENWPISFDLADPFPKGMFASIKGNKHYTGPAFREVMHPATWATDRFLTPSASGRGRPKESFTLRQEFSDLWVWIEETDTFLCKEMPEINHPLSLFNAMVKPFSHTPTPGQSLQSVYKGRTAKVCYRPDVVGRIVTDRTTSAINLHTPSSIRPEKGDPAPWIEFCEYLIPDADERRTILRWCATLIARPQVRMLYGLLLISERQGMGKSTLGERILAPLVGMNNTGFPGERDIVESNFNGWVANKRLIVVGEIYTGQSFKAYNILKSYITDKQIEVNEKFQRPYRIENWVHMVACSNSRKALRMEETDRRWFYPQLAETPWKREKWGEFFAWLQSGGLQIIAQWAEDFGDYIATGEQPPMTVEKKSLIEESKGEALLHWRDIMEAVEEGKEVVAFALNEVKDTMKEAHGKVYESALHFKKEALARGWFTINDRVLIDGALSYIVGSPALFPKIEAVSEASERKAIVKDALSRLKDRVQVGF